MSNHIQLKEVNNSNASSTTTTNGNKNNSNRNQRQRRVSSIVLNACIRDDTKVYSNNTNTKGGTLSILYFLMKLNNNILHDRFLFAMRILIYPVTMT